jgi:hypothetical protein
MTRIEAILAARKKRKAGEFDRKITRSTPCDLDTDMIEFDCGHIRTASVSSLELHESIRSLEKSPGKKDRGEYCDRCAEEWIVRNTGAK